MDQLVALLTALAIPLLFAWVVVDLVSKREASGSGRRTRK